MKREYKSSSSLFFSMSLLQRSSDEVLLSQSSHADYHSHRSKPPIGPSSSSSSSSSPTIPKSFEAEDIDGLSLVGSPTWLRLLKTMPPRRQNNSQKIPSPDSSSHSQEESPVNNMFTPDPRLVNLLQRAWFVEHQKLLRGENATHPLLSSSSSSFPLSCFDSKAEVVQNLSEFADSNKSWEK